MWNCHPMMDFRPNANTRSGDPPGTTDRPMFRRNSGRRAPDACWPFHTNRIIAMKLQPSASSRMRPLRAAIISLMWSSVMLTGPVAAAEYPLMEITLTSQRHQQIESALRNGDLTPLQAEFMLLTTRNFDSPRDRFIAMREWQSQHGDAMKAELETKHAQEEPLRLAHIAAARQERAAQIAEGLASGRLGPLEAELADLMNREFANPGERMQALRKWNIKNREAFDAERRVRHGDEAADREERMAAIQGGEIFLSVKTLESQRAG